MSKAEAKPTFDSSVAVIERPTEGGTALDTIAPRPDYSAEPVFDREDVTYPRLKLLQFLSKEASDGSGSKAGQWLASGFEGADDVTVVPVGAAKGRKYTTGSNDAYTVLCESTDAKIGYGTPGGVCATCPLSQWTTDPVSGKRVAPLCGEEWNYVFYSPDHGLLIGNLAKTGLTTARQLNSFIQSRKLGNFAVKFSSKKETNGAGQPYYVPIMRMVKVEPDVLESAQMLRPS